MLVSQTKTCRFGGARNIKTEKALNKLCTCCNKRRNACALQPMFQPYSWDVARVALNCLVFIIFPRRTGPLTCTRLKHSTKVRVGGGTASYKSPTAAKTVSALVKQMFRFAQPSCVNATISNRPSAHVYRPFASSSSPLFTPRLAQRFHMAPLVPREEFWLRQNGICAL